MMSSKKKAIIIVIIVLVSLMVLQLVIGGICFAVVNAKLTEKITLYCYVVNTDKVEKIKIKKVKSSYDTFDLPEQSLENWNFVGYVFSTSEYKKENDILQNQIESNSIIITTGTIEVSHLFFDEYDTKKMYLAPVFERENAKVVLNMASGETKTLSWRDTYAKYKKSKYEFNDNSNFAFKFEQSGYWGLSYASQGFFTEKSDGTLYIDNNLNELVPFEQIKNNKLYEHQLKYNLIYRYPDGSEKIIPLLSSAKCQLPSSDPIAPANYKFSGWFVENTQIKISSTDNLQTLLDTLVSSGKYCDYNTIVIIPMFKEM